MGYADTHRQEYLGWAQSLADAPTTPTRRLEFAILSANCLFGTAVEAWRGIAQARTTDEVRRGMATARLGLTANKLAAIMWVRARPDVYPVAPYHTYRRTHKLPGLGLAKLSFGACLIDPLGADIICLDTHMWQAYTGKVPGNHDFSNLGGYEALERQVLAEAEQIGLPPFVYQWAVWDNQRGKAEHHGFLQEG